MKQRRILIIRTDRVGDVVMITPVIREIRKKFPNSFIATLTAPHTKDILKNNPHLDVSITDDLNKNSFWKVVKELKKYKFTDGLMCMPTERANYQIFFAGIKNRIGVGRKFYQFITFTNTVDRRKYDIIRHEADYCMDLARKIGVESNNLKPEIFVTQNEKESARSFLFSKGISETDFKIIIHTGSGKSAPNWSEEKYRELVDKIITKFSTENKNIKILLSAIEMSKDFSLNLTQKYKNIILDISSETKPLRKLITIISECNLLIASSTGPLHIASALNIKTIGLYCHRPMSCIKHWGTLGKNSINLEVSKEHCDKYCSKDKEICAIENGIEIDEVLRSI